MHDEEYFSQQAEGITDPAEEDTNYVSVSDLANWVFAVARETL